MNWFEKHLGSNWEGILAWAVVGAIVIIGGALYVGIPKYQYAHATPENKCQIDLKKLHDDDRFCDYANQIQSHKKISQDEAKLKEEARRAALTPMQRCEEDHKTVSDPDTGEVFVPICKDDGTYEVKTTDELQSELEIDRNSDPGSPSQPSNCNPNYSPCVPNVSYDLDCPDIGFPVRVIGSDVYRFDADGDGIGCESY